MDNRVGPHEPWRKEPECDSRTHSIARATIEVIGRAGFLTVVIGDTWVAVQPRRTDTGCTETERRSHARAAAARANEILTYARALRDTLPPDPARELLAGRELRVAADDGPPDLVLLDFTLERLARFSAKLLRQPGGLQLRRREADAIADALEALAGRSLRSTRKRAAA